MSARGCMTLCALLLAPGCREAAGDELATTGRPAEPPAPASAPAAASPVPQAPAAPPASAGPGEPRCREQAPQDFLLRKHQIAKIGAPAEEQRRIEEARKRAIAYRTRQYGRFPGFGSRRDNLHPPTFYAKRTTFMGLPLVLNAKVVPALRCVEEALRRDCADHPYRPRSAGGLRGGNTYKDYEVSNHVYGIALDVDSDLNPCCNCVGFWRDHPACRQKVSSPFERMAMPRCWVDVFERYGFYWLGHDELEDTMHFEFLGEPERVLE